MKKIAIAVLLTLTASFAYANVLSLEDVIVAVQDGHKVFPAVTMMGEIFLGGDVSLEPSCAKTFEITNTGGLVCVPYGATSPVLFGQMSDHTFKSDSDQMGYTDDAPTGVFINWNANHVKLMATDLDPGATHYVLVVR